MSTITGGCLTVTVDGKLRQIELTPKMAYVALRALRTFENERRNGPTVVYDPKTSKPGKQLTRSESFEAERMWRHHWDLDRIAEHFGCSQQAVGHAINRVRGGRYDS